MPKKSKHSQRQSQKQIVNVRIGSLETKSKRRRSRRRKSQAVDVKAMDYLQPQQLAPTIIMQTGYGAPMGGARAIEGTRVPAPEPIMGTRTIGTSPIRPAMEDVGVGTEGFVDILYEPSRVETLGELIEPVSQHPEYKPRQFFDTIQPPSDPMYGIVIPSESSLPSGEPTEDPIPLSSAVAYFPYGTKDYYVNKIMELTGKRLNVGDYNKSQLKKMYNASKSLSKSSKAPK